MPAPQIPCKRRATSAQGRFIAPLLRSLHASLGIAHGPRTPPGVVARVLGGRTMRVDSNVAPASATFPGNKTGLLAHRACSGRIDLEPCGEELAQ